MVKKDIFLKVKGFDQTYGIYYEETDFAAKIKILGYSVCLIPQAVIYHYVPPINQDPARNYAVTNELRTYRIARNRIIFMKKYARKEQYLIFILIFLPFFTLSYLLIILKTKNYHLIKVYLKGMKDGLKT
jgi:GT2 family glycosyltransferase